MRVKLYRSNPVLFLGMGEWRFGKRKREAQVTQQGYDYTRDRIQDTPRLERSKVAVTKAGSP